ncbi:824d4a98-b746-4938-b69c-10f529638d96 [Sclerotinia trifoliorum]|uniref:chitinase n=1 Tax=Sclerotinia trifoliorum TaxID=28548 RepID=A0A8H2VZQ9_9HELO|nr:824d4a98-b746-4938-b69c-10f529638d96 [Sclerotinia trifoliorum]
MYSSKSFTVAAAAFSLIGPSVALYDASSPANLALYWGSGPSQTNLSYYCEQSTIDIIPLAFMNVFPAQGDGYPAENFGNACYGQPIFTPGPGYPLEDVDTSKDQLYVQCPGIQEGIPYCQSLGKKILLSLGGASNTYQLTGVADGEYFADFLWGSYGPFKQSWLDNGGIRPMDGGYYGTDPNIHIDIDGFDFDIEIASTDSSEGYIAMINRLREHFAENPSKKYFISGAPQCPLPEPNMGTMIASAKFDLLWIQFYNNGQAQCTARQWTENYAITGQKESEEFTYDEWIATVNSGASSGASIYIGVLGSPLAGTATDYISPLEARTLIESYHDKPQFGGVMIWEATYSQENTDAELNGDTYHGFIKSCLSPYAPPPPTSISSVVSSEIASSSSSTSEASITSSATLSIESSASASSTLILISSASIPISISESSAAASSTSSTYSSQSSAAASSTSLEASITFSSTLTSAASTSTVQSFSSSESSASRSLISSTVSSASESSTAQSSSASGLLISLTVSSASASPTQASSGYSVPGYSQNATSTLTPSQSLSSTSNSVTTSISSNSHSPEPSSGYTVPPYSFNKTISGVYSTKPYSTKSVVTGTGASSKLRPTKSLGSGVKSCKGRTKTRTKTSSSGLSGSASSSIIIPTTAPYGNSTYSQSSTSPASSSTTSAGGVAVSSGSASKTGYIPTESTKVGSSSTGVGGISSGSITSSGSLPSETSSLSTSGSVPSGSSSITSVVQYTTSTAYFTTVYTVTSCAATVTDCPARIGSVTTETISSHTTICLVTATATSSAEGVSVSLQSSAQGLSLSPTPASSAQEPPTSSVSLSSTQGLAISPITSVVQYTTSTAYVTSVYTIKSCAATVTDCPARIGSVTTETIYSYTTICPVTETSGNSGVVSSTSSAIVPTQTTAFTSYGTSTVYQKSVYTITSCAPSVTDCPARSGQVTTETISSYTPVYTITLSSAPVSVPTSRASSAARIETLIPVVGTSSVAGVSSATPASGSSATGIVTSLPIVSASSIADESSPAATPEVSLSYLYTTQISTLINSQTTTISAVIVPSTITVIPVPIAPTTSVPAYSSIAPPYGAGNGTLAVSVTLITTASSVSITFVPIPSSYIVKAEGESTKSGSGISKTQSAVTSPAPSAVTFEGGAGRMFEKMGVWTGLFMIGLVFLV